jgi:diadenosine hexaphosphate hydrolase (ATP-forming)
MPRRDQRNRTNSQIEHLRKYLAKPKASIQEIVREPTSGGIIFRHGKDGEIEILLIQDAKDRWTIPKGHIEEGETAIQTARREIGEEAGLHDIDMLGWLGKIHFRYRRIDRLVLMTTQIYLVRVRTDGSEIQKESWMNGIKWFSFNEALDLIEYEDIAKLMLKARTRIREEKL